MPQDLTTAPVDPSPKWPSGYIAALREMGAQEKTIPFCIRWVRSFFASHSGQRRRDLGRAEIEAFLREVAMRPNVANWQVQQAREALEIYYERFRGIALAPRPQGVGGKAMFEASAVPSQGAAAQGKMQPSPPRSASGTRSRYSHLRQDYDIAGSEVNPCFPGAGKPPCSKSGQVGNRALPAAAVREESVPLSNVGLIGSLLYGTGMRISLTSLRKASKAP